MSERKKSKAEIDYLNKNRIDGSTLLPYEDEDAPEPEEQKQAKIDAKKKEDEDAESEKVKKEVDGQKAKEPEVGEPTEDQFLAYLQKKTGKQINSIDELLNPKQELTEEEKKDIQEKRESAKVAYGLSTGKFTRKLYESFISDTKNPKELVLAQYIADQLEEDDTLTESDIEEEFNDKFGLNADPDSRQHKRGMKEISVLASSIIKDKYDTILGLDKDFSAEEIRVNSENEKGRKILSLAPAYKKDVEEVFTEIKKLSVAISKDEMYDVDLEDSTLDELKASMLLNDYASSMISKGWTKEGIKEVVRTAAITKDLSSIVRKAAEKYYIKRQAGLRGVPATRLGASINETELDERNKIVVARYGPAPVAN